MKNILKEHKKDALPKQSTLGEEKKNKKSRQHLHYNKNTTFCQKCVDF